jgi:hypothetical protein
VFTCGVQAAAAGAVLGRATLVIEEDMGLRRSTGVRAGLVVALTLAAALLGSSPALAATANPKPSRCATPAELNAIASRILETELLVGALSCAQTTQYNAFMEKFRKTQNEQARTLQAMFKRMYGKASQRELDAFITRLGNASALRSLELQLAYCQGTYDLFEEAASLSETDYHRLTAKPSLAGRHPYPACAAGQDAVKPAKTKG